MPGLNGTGPRGMGPMTGGARGWCNPYSPLYYGGMPYGMPYLPYRSYGVYGGPMMAGMPYGGTMPYYGGFARPYAYGWPRFGIGYGRGFFGRGIGWGGRGMGMGRRWW